VPAVGFDTKFKTNSIFDTDQFRLKFNERARISILDEKAQMEYTHYVKNGQFRQDGSQSGSYYICLGNTETMADFGRDAENCPACKVAQPGRDVAVSEARRRFAIYILRYRTNNAGAVMQPISLALEIWVFGDDKYTKLFERAQEHGDLRGKDLNIKCTTQQYQGYDIDVAGKCFWREDTNAKAQVKELAAVRSIDLPRILGRKVGFEQLEKLVSDATPRIGPSDIDDAIESSAAEVLGINEPAGTFAMARASDTELPAEGTAAVDLDEILGG
jgi:hypothetical protein